MVGGATAVGVADDELAAAAGRIGTSIFHPAGTTRMGRDGDGGAVLDARAEAQDEAFASAPAAKRRDLQRRRVAAPAPAQPVPPPPPTETPPPPGTEDYRACLAKALANAKDANETLALARVYARTVTT